MFGTLTGEEWKEEEVVFLWGLTFFHQKVLSTKAPTTYVGVIDLEAGPRGPKPSSPILPRKEVIQPQLPLQLPCYDFVPVTSPTLGAYVPCGFDQRLQVLPASMT